MKPLRFEALEPRILYSADAALLLAAGGADALLAGGAGAVDTAHESRVLPAPAPVDARAATVDAATPAAAPYAAPAAAPAAAGVADAAPAAPATPALEQPAREIVFIDSRVPDAQRFVDDLARQRADGREIEVVMLSAADDGVAQIGRVLHGEHGLAAVHIVSHGAAGEIEIGSTRLDAAALAADAPAVAAWGAALAADGDLLLYGCEVASGASGQAFIQQLARLTGADVAASDNATGDAAHGGDWVLEQRTGTIEAESVADAPLRSGWHGLLAAPVISNLAGDTLAYTEGQAATPIDQGTAASVSLNDPGGWSNATLTVSMAANGWSGADELAIRNQGTGFGQVGVSGSNVTYSGVTVGSFSGGTASGDLVVTFNAVANDVIAGAVLDAVTYRDTDAAAPVTAARTVRFVVTSSGGGASAPADTTVTVAAVNDAPSAVLLLAPGTASLLVNGSFETNNGAANTVTSGTGVTVAGWTATGGEGFEVWNNYNSTLAPAPANASDGLSRLELDVSAAAVNGISQTVSTAAGRTYLLSFDFTNRGGSSVPGSGVDVFWRGSRIATVNQTVVGWQTWRMTVTGSGGTDALAFVETVATNDSAGSQIDNVLLQPLAAPASITVPENAANGTAVASARTLDPDGGADSWTYTLADSAGGRFAIDAVTGAVTVANGSLLDFESAASHAITVRSTDAGGLYRDQAFTIVVTDVNEAPVAVADSATAVEAGGTANATAGTNPTGNVLANDSDPDAGDTLSVSGVAAGNVGSASGNVGTGVAGSYGALVVAAGGGYTYTVDNANAAVQALRNASTTLVDTFTYTVRDAAGLASSTTLTVTIRGADDAPVATAGGGASAAYTENGAPVVVDAGITLADIDDATFAGASVAITANFQSGADVLGFTDQNGITGSWNAGSGVLTLTGSATVAQYQAALRSVTYANTSDDPSTAARSVSFAVDDGSLGSNAASRSVGVTAVNDVPVNHVPASFAGTEDTPFALTGISITDPDAGSSLLTTTLTVARGTLAATAGGGVTVGGSGTANLTLAGTLASLNAFLAGASAPVYSPAANDNGAVQLSMVTSDGQNTGTGGALQAGAFDYRFVDGTPPGDEPDNIAATGGITGVAQNLSVGALATALTGSNQSFGVVYTGIVDVTTGGSYTFTVGADDAARLRVDGTQVAYAFFNTVSGSLSLAAGRHTIELRHAQDTGGTGLSASYSGPNTGGSSTPLLSAAAVGRLVSQTATGTINLAAVDDAPVATASAGSAAYTENAAPVVVDAGITVGDVDNATLAGATVAIAANFQPGADVLGFVNQNGITGSWNAGTGVLTLSGSATVAQYQAALRSVTYVNTSDDPSTAARSVSFTVDDGSLLSAATTRNLTVTAVNDAPVGNLPASFAGTEDTPLRLAGISITDPDAGSSPLTTTLTVARGTLAASAGGGVTVGGSNSAALTLTGTLANLNAYLGGASAPVYSPATDDDGAVALSMVTSDGQASGSANSTINLAAVDDAPVLAAGGPAAAAYTEGAAPVVIAPGLTLGDIDSPTLAGARVAITGNRASGQDVLGFAAQNGISGSYDAATGVLTLAGSATAAQYQAALRSVTYANSSATPSTATRTVSFTVNDGQLDSNTVARTVGVAAVDGAPSDLVLLSAGAVNLVVNGSFEVNNGAANAATLGTSVTVSGWTAIGGQGFEVWNNFNNGGSPGPATASDGVSRLELDVVAGGVNGISQQVNTVAGQRYLLGFDFSHRAGATAGDSGVDVYWRGVRVMTVDTATVGWQAQRLVVTGSGGADTLAFVETAATDDGLGSQLDNVTLRAIESPAIAVAENSANGSVVAAAAAVDADSGNAFTYALLNDAGGRFAIDASTGVVTVANGALLDFESANSHDVTVRATDGGGSSVDRVFTIAVTDVNEAPVALADAAIAVEAGGVGNATPGSNPAGNLLANDSDPDAGDVLTLVGSAAGVVTPATGSLVGVAGSYGTLSAAADGSFSYTLDNANAAVQALHDATTTLVDTFSYTVSDAGGLTRTATLSVTIRGANDAPAIVPGAGTLAYTENDAATPVAPGLTLTDPDNALLTGATVAITANHRPAEDVLAFAAQNGIGGSWNAATGVLTLAGSATVAQYQAALRSVTYANTSDDPDTAARSVSFSASDGSLQGAAAVRLVHVTAVNDAPVATAPAGLAAVEDTPLALSGLSIADPDARGSLLTATLTVGTGTLTAAAGGAVTVGGSGTGSLTLTGTLADLNAYLAGAGRPVFDAPADFNGTVTLTLVASDGIASGATATTAIGVAAVDDAPVLVAGGGAAPAYVENAAPVAVDAGITVTDVDSATLTGATVAITTNFVAGEDTLAFAGANGISGHWNAATGVLTLTGSATVAQYQAALRSVTYANGSDDPTPLARGVSFSVVDDTAAASNTVARGVTVSAVDDAPVVVTTSAGAGALSYAENDAPTAIDPALTVSDADDALLAGARAAVSLNYAPGEDVLGFVDQHGITGHWNAATGVLTLTGSATVAQYQAALRSVTYANGSNSPSTATRTVGFSVDDGSLASAVATRRIVVRAVNDAPADIAFTVPLPPGPRVAENAANGTVVATARAIDPDRGDSAAYTLTDSAGGRFAIDAATGVVRVADGGRLDFEAAAAHDIVVRATDGGGLWVERRLTIAVVDVDEPVVARPDAAFAVEAGGVANGTPGVDPVGNVLDNDSDPDAGDTRTVVGVAAAFGAGAGAGGAGSVGRAVAGRYGAIVVEADGRFVYTVDNANAAVQALKAGSAPLVDSFAYDVADAAGLVSRAQVNVTIAGADDAPAIVANRGLQVAEGAAGNVVTAALLSASDVDTAAAALRYTLTGAPAHGVLRLGDAALAAGAGFTQADIDAGRLHYDHDGSETTADGFDFTLVDDDGNGAGGHAVAGRFAIAVTPVNAHAPAFVVGDDTTTTVRVAENGTAVTTVRAVDADLPAVALRYRIAGGADAALFRIDESTGALRFDRAPDFESPADADRDNVYEVQVAVSDGERDGVRGWRVVVTDAAEAPSSADATLATAEDVPLRFAVADFGFVDPDAGDALAALRIEAIGGGGVFSLASAAAAVGDMAAAANSPGEPLVVGQRLAAADIARLRFTPAADASGAGYATLTVRVEDRSGLLAARAAQLTVDVAAVDDAPRLLAAQLLLPAAAPFVLTLNAANLAASDVDSDVGGLRFIVSDVRDGRFESTAAAGVALHEFSQADVQAGRIRFVATAVATGHAAAAPSFDVAVSDGVQTSAPVAATVRVAAAAPAPAGPTALPSLPSLPAAAAGGGGPGGAGSPSEQAAAGGGGSGAGSAAVRPPAVPVVAAGSAPTGSGAAASASSPAAGPTGSLPTAAGPSAVRAASAVVDGALLSRQPRADAIAEDADKAVAAPAPDGAARGVPAAGDIAVAPPTRAVLRAAVRAAPAEASGGAHNDDDGRSVELDVVTDALHATGAALTAGGVWWALRSGGLAASLLVVLPAWRHVDLLAVLPDDEDDDWDDDDGGDPPADGGHDEEARDEHAVRRVFEPVAHAAAAAKTERSPR